MKFTSFLFAVAFAFSSSHAAEPAPFEEDRFEVTTLAIGMASPIEMEIAPDGRIFFIELGGKLRAYLPQEKQIIEVGKLDVFTPQENGLIGLALAPDFATTGHIYLNYSPKTFDGQHVSRFTLKGNELDLTSEKLIVKFAEQRKECCHHAGALEFGPDGALFIASGDNTHPGGDSGGYAPIDERAGREPFDAQKSASNTNTMVGKILRIIPKPDGGYTIPDGNLFPKDGSKGLPEIYVMGCRNPWRIAVDQKTGYLYWGEVGPDAGGDGPRGSRGYDEVNQARKAGNFGWPYFVGPNAPYFDYDFEAKKIGEKFDPEKPVNHSPNNTGMKELPPAQPAWIYYPYGDSQEFPELGKGGRTACAGPIYRYDAAKHGKVGFPEQFDNCMIFFDWNRPFIKWARLDENSNLVKIESFVKGLQFKRPVAFQFAPDGTLYMMDYGTTWGMNPDSRLLHITYPRGNRAPVARAEAKHHIGKAPLKVTLSSEGTRDKDPSDKLSYQWRIATATDATQVGKIVAKDANAQVTFEKPGVYSVELLVTDAAGEKSTAVVPVLVGNDPPRMKFTYPLEGDFADEGKSINYEVAIVDSEDGESDFEMPDMNTRTTISAMIQRAGIEAADPPGLALMKKSDCFNCHAVDRKIIGPSYLEVAAKYKKDDKALAAAVERVIKGSTGVWGQVPMLPHSHHTADEAKQMVAWVFDLKPDIQAAQIAKGVIGAVPLPKVTKETAGGSFILEASYTDKGASPIGPLTAHATLRLRHRQIEAELADKVQGSQVLGGGSASGRQFVGSINHGSHLLFRSINLARVSGITCRTASAGQGGKIEFRAGKPDGKLLATLEVKVTGGWETWQENNAAFELLDEATDVYAVFVNPGKSGLMNVDWVRFEPRE